MSASFVRYLTSATLRLELNQVVGLQWSEVGRAQLALADVKEDLRLEVLGARPRTRQLEVIGSSGRAGNGGEEGAVIGSVKVRSNE